MRVNLSGLIAPEHIIGRDAFIQAFWNTLQEQSVILSAERRFGKTCVTKKMQNKPAQETIAIYHDLEGCHSPLDFTETLLRETETHLSAGKRATGKVRKLLKELGGLELGDFVKLPQSMAARWKDLILGITEDLSRLQDKRMVFFWDEMPLMLHNIRDRSHPQTAMELLDLLRSVRHNCPSIRMVFTGSVSMSNFLASLKKQGYANEPTNDMRNLELPPLDLEHGVRLARLLLDGERVPVDDELETAEAIAQAGHCIPFYIHHIIDRLKLRSLRANPQCVTQLLDDCIKDPRDPWNLHYYRNRIDAHYTEPEKGIALVFLDLLADEPSGLPPDELFNQARSRMVITDNEALRDVLRLVTRDAYLVRDDSGRVRFRYEMIRRWWQWERTAI